MSIPVPHPSLATEIAAFGSAYLLSVDASGAPRLRSVAPVLTDGTLRVQVGPGSAASIAQRPAVTLLWPPVRGHHALVVDGTASVTGTEVSVDPTWAVLHRTVDLPDVLPTVDPDAG